MGIQPGLGTGRTADRHGTRTASRLRLSQPTLPSDRPGAGYKRLLSGYIGNPSRDDPTSPARLDHPTKLASQMNQFPGGADQFGVRSPKVFHLCWTDPAEWRCVMKVFNRASSLEGDDALTTAAGAVVERVVSFPRPRSLCEIQADEEDYQWLSNWASQLSPLQLRRWLEGVGSRRIALQSGDLNLSCTEAMGCLLLLLASESARRHASEGYVWSAVRGKFTGRSRRILFAQGQPRGLFKDAIEAAARKLDLRHVFGIEGTQNYYLSV